MRLRDKLAGGRFVITAEVDPPRAAEFGGMLDKARHLAGLVDAVNVTDCPLANVRMNAIVASHLIQRETGLETIFHLTCRDRNIIGLQSDLLGAAALGVNNLLVLAGDPPERGNHPTAKGVYDVDTPGLVRMVAALNRGATYAGTELAGAADFAVAVAANPAADDLDRELTRLAEKVAAGAAFVQTQPVFDLATVEQFEAKRSEYKLEIPILYGLLPLKSREFARRMARIPGIRIPDPVLRRVEVGPEGEGFRLAGELAAQLSGVVRGIHIFPMGSVPVVVGIVDALEHRSGSLRA